MSGQRAVGGAIRWSALLCVAAVAAALVWSVATEFPHVTWVAQLSAQGSPPPERAPHSPTGYVHGERQFLGFRERGETYRWIAATQDLLATGPFAGAHYDSDNVPTGRPRLLPRLYAAWLGAVSTTLHATAGEPTALAVERGALWEPLVSHVALILIVAGVCYAGFGATCAAIAAVLLAGFPIFTGQFLAGTPAPRTWALFLSAAVLAHAIGATLRNADGKRHSALGPFSAVMAAVVLWLDPEIGFPTVLLLGMIGTGDERRSGAVGPLGWSLIGGATAIAGWALDRAPWAPSAGEFRYVHPFYAFAWIGVGLALHGWRLHADGKRKFAITAWAGGLGFVAPLIVVQLARHYYGWLYPTAAMHRLTSLDETIAYSSIAAWITAASPAEVALIMLPTAAAVVALGVWIFSQPGASAPRRATRVAIAVAYAGLLILAAAKVRWLVVSSVLAVPLCSAVIASAGARRRSGLIAVAAVILAVLVAGSLVPPLTLRRPSGTAAARPADLDALIYRHLAHWLASHSVDRGVAALGPPEISDALVFHGGCRVLISTAWECYDGQVAASRILSAPEATEAEAVLQSREITHVILTSWDKVLPLLVREPKEPGRTTLYARLQRWVLPPYLRPLPYHLPRTPGYEAEKVAVFKVTGAQDEALLLSRLAEYFVEVERPEPATTAAAVLARTFPDDPNARMACALVDAATGNSEGFQRALTRLAADPTAGDDTLPWDRRVQRAIVFALGGRHDLARTALTSCLSDASADQLAELTPLQAYRLLALMRRYECAFPDPHLADIAAAMCSEYGKK